VSITNNAGNKSVFPIDWVALNTWRAMYGRVLNVEIPTLADATVASKPRFQMQIRNRYKYVARRLSWQTPPSSNAIFWWRLWKGRASSQVVIPVWPTTPALVDHSFAEVGAANRSISPRAGMRSV